MDKESYAGMRVQLGHKRTVYSPQYYTCTVSVTMNHTARVLKIYSK